MGLLSKLAPIAGGLIGNAIVPGIGGKIGSALGSAAAGAASSSSGSKKATAAQLAALEDAKKQIGQSYTDIKGYQQPALATLQPGVNALTGRLGLPTGDAAAAPANALNPGTYGDTANPTAPTPYTAPQAPGAFSYTLEDYKASPGYQYRQDQARKAVLAGASATGGMQSGAALKELYDRGDQIAYQDFGNERAFALGLNRNAMSDYRDMRDFNYGLTRDARSDYQDTRNYLTDRFDTGTNDLFRYTDIGRGAANTLSSAASNYGQQMAGLITDGGNARAANYLTQGQIGSDLSGDIGGLVASLFKGGGGSASGSPSVYASLPWIKG